MKHCLRLVIVSWCLCWGPADFRGAEAADPADTPRIEARSASYLLVGLVHGDSMNLHVSRLLDNTPVRDAQVTVVLRGRTYPATAQVDGGYAVSAQDLTLPGAAAVEFQIAQGNVRESVHAELQASMRTTKEDGQSGIRQYAWWILNFGVCIGALVLYSRRSKKSES